MATLLLLTNAMALSAEVLPALGLLSHAVRVVPAEPAALIDAPAADVVLLDARRELAHAKSLCQVMRATGMSAPLLGVLTEGGLAGLTADWGLDDVLLDTAGQPIRQSGTESGFLRIVPGGEAELLLAHPTGIIEMYFGPAEPAKLSLRTDSVVRSPHAKEYNAGTRHYGLVDGDLMWVMDMAAMGTPLTSHLSAQLKRVG